MHQENFAYVIISKLSFISEPSSIIHLEPKSKSGAPFWSHVKGKISEKPLLLSVKEYRGFKKRELSLSPLTTSQTVYNTLLPKISKRLKPRLPSSLSKVNFYPAIQMASPISAFIELIWRQLVFKQLSNAKSAEVVKREWQLSIVC